MVERMVEWGWLSGVGWWRWGGVERMVEWGG